MFSDSDLLGALKTPIARDKRAAILSWRLTRDSAVDPYLAWQLLSKAAPPSDRSGAPDIPVLIELDRRVVTPTGELRVLETGARVGRIWPALITPRSADSSGRRVLHALIDLDGLAAMFMARCAITAVDCGGAMVPILRFELGRARRRQDEGMRSLQRSVGMSGMPDLNTASGYDDWLAVGQKLAKQEAAKNAGLKAPPAAGPLICVVDDRCAYASPNLPPFKQLWHQGGNGPTLSRLDQAEVWDRGLNVARRTGPDGVDQFDLWGGVYGRELEVGGTRTSAHVSDESSEAATYRRHGYIDPLFRWSHGGAVLSLVAAAETWGVSEPEDHKRWFARPTAPAELHFVQLPIPAVMDTSGGSLAGHALDAIRWAVEMAQDGQKVIVNLSYGTHSGGHDGTSLWDAGLYELLEAFDGICTEARRKELHVVLPAGNSHGQRSHASAQLSAGAAALELRWKVLPDNVDDSYLEIWLPPAMKASVEVVAPDGARAVLDQPGLKDIGPGSTRSAAVLWPQVAAQSQLGQMVLVAVAGTTTSAPAPEYLSVLSLNAVKPSQVEPQGTSAPAASAQAPYGGRAPHGVWQVRVRWLAGSSGHVHAWVQRSDVAPGRGQQTRGYRGRQSYLLDSADDPQGYPVDPRFTINGIATLKHDRLHVVGAMRRMDRALSAYSSSGPNRICDKRFEGPDRVIVADESLNQPGLLVKGLLSGARLRLPGTSMAAAAYTRLLYEHLSTCTTGAPVLGRCPLESTRELDPSARGSPTRAHPMHRGEHVRLLADHPNGTLDQASCGACQSGLPTGRQCVRKA